MKIIARSLAGIRRLQSYIDHSWYLFAVGFLAFVDFFVVFIPGDGIIVVSAASRPRRWWLLGGSMALGSLLGGLALAMLVKSFGEPFIEWLAPALFESALWVRAEEWMEGWGVWAIAAIGASPFAQQPSVVIASLADMSLGWIALGLGGGRFFKFLLYAWIASHAPRLLAKIPTLKEELKELNRES
jgi:hypothetical protein